MTFKPARLLLALLAMAAAPAFAQNIAVVNGKPIPTSRLNAVVKSVVDQGQQPDSPQLREQIKRELIEREVLMQEAEKQGFGKNAQVRQALDGARQSIKIDDVRPTKFPTLEEVKPQVAEMLMQRKVVAYQEQLVKKAKVQ